MKCWFCLFFNQKKKKSGALTRASELEVWYFECSYPKSHFLSWNCQFLTIDLLYIYLIFHIFPVTDEPTNRGCVVYLPKHLLSVRKNNICVHTSPFVVKESFFLSYRWILCSALCLCNIFFHKCLWFLAWTTLRIFRKLSGKVMWHKYVIPYIVLTQTLFHSRLLFALSLHEHYFNGRFFSFHTLLFHNWFFFHGFRTFFARNLVRKLECLMTSIVLRWRFFTTLCIIQSFMIRYIILNIIPIFLQTHCQLGCG